MLTIIVTALVIAVFWPVLLTLAMFAIGAVVTVLAIIVSMLVKVFEWCKAQ